MKIKVEDLKGLFLSPHSCAPRLKKNSIVAIQHKLCV